MSETTSYFSKNLGSITSIATSISAINFVYNPKVNFELRVSYAPTDLIPVSIGMHLKDLNLNGYGFFYNTFFDSSNNNFALKKIIGNNPVEADIISITDNDFKIYRNAQIYGRLFSASTEQPSQPKDFATIEYVQDYVDTHGGGGNLTLTGDVSGSGSLSSPVDVKVHGITSNKDSVLMSLELDHTAKKFDFKINDSTSGSSVQTNPLTINKDNLNLNGFTLKGLPLSSPTSDDESVSYFGLKSALMNGPELPIGALLNFGNANSTFRKKLKDSLNSPVLIDQVEHGTNIIRATYKPSDGKISWQTSLGGTTTDLFSVQSHSNGSVAPIMKLSCALDANSKAIVNLLAPTNDQDPATKKYVDDQIAQGGGGGTPAQIAASSSFLSDSSHNTTLNFSSNNTYKVNSYYQDSSTVVQEFDKFSAGTISKKLVLNLQDATNRTRAPVIRVSTTMKNEQLIPGTTNPGSGFVATMQASLEDMTGQGYGQIFSYGFYEGSGPSTLSFSPQLICDYMANSPSAVVLKSYVDTLIPVGAIILWPTSKTIPFNYLQCNGSTFSQSTYSELYASLGNSTILPNIASPSNKHIYVIRSKSTVY